MSDSEENSDTSDGVDSEQEAEIEEDVARFAFGDFKDPSPVDPVLEPEENEPIYEDDEELKRHIKFREYTHKMHATLKKMASAQKFKI